MQEIISCEIFFRLADGFQKEFVPENCNVFYHVSITLGEIKLARKTGT